jgi:hypothetical protein
VCVNFLRTVVCMSTHIGSQLTFSGKIACFRPFLTAYTLYICLRTTGIQLEVTATESHYEGESGYGSRKVKEFKMKGRNKSTRQKIINKKVPVPYLNQINLSKMFKRDCLS